MAIADDVPKPTTVELDSNGRTQLALENTGQTTFALDPESGTNADTLFGEEVGL